MKRFTILGVLVGIVLISSGAFGATLNWLDNSTNEMGFNVERKVEACAGAGAFSALGSVGVNVKTYADTTTGEGNR